MRIDTMFGSYDGIMFRVAKYAADGSVYLQAFSLEDGPIATLTVCLDDHLLDVDETYLDTNNCPWVVGFMEKYGLATLTGRTSISGYCMYPVAKINMDEVMKHLYVEAC